MDRGAWRAPGHSVTKSWTRLSDLHTTSTNEAFHLEACIFWFLPCPPVQPKQAFQIWWVVLDELSKC